MNRMNIINVFVFLIAAAAITCSPASSQLDRAKSSKNGFGKAQNTQYEIGKKQNNIGKSNVNLAGNYNVVRIDSSTTIKIYKVGIKPSETVRLKRSDGLIPLLKVPNTVLIFNWTSRHINKPDVDNKYYHRRHEPDWEALSDKAKEDERKKIYSEIPKDDDVVLVQNGVKVSVMGGADDMSNVHLKYIRVKLLNGLDKGRIGFVNKEFVTID